MKKQKFLAGNLGWQERELVEREMHTLWRKITQVQREIQELAESQGLITATFNHDVKVFKKEESRSYQSITVKRIQAVEEIPKSVVLNVKKTKAHLLSNKSKHSSYFPKESPWINIGSWSWTKSLQLVDDNGGNMSMVTATN